MPGREAARHLWAGKSEILRALRALRIAFRELLIINNLR